MTERKINLEPLAESPFNLGDTLIALRRFNGFSQREVAGLAGISQAYLHQLENNDTSNPKSNVVIGLARVFGVGLYYWNGQEDNRVFLTHQAQVTAELRQNPQAKKIVDELSRKLPFTKSPVRYYIDLMQQREPLLAKYFERKKSLGLDQKDIKRESGLSQGYMSQFENGLVTNPFLATIKRLAKALNVSEYTLLGIERIWPDSTIRNIDNFFRDENNDSQTRSALFRILESIREFFDRLKQAQQPLPSSINSLEQIPPLQP